MISDRASPYERGELLPPIPQLSLADLTLTSLDSSLVSPTRSTQLALADEVSAALEQLNSILSQAHIDVWPDVARSVAFYDRTQEGCRQTVSRLVNQLCRLYAVEFGHQKDAVLSSLTECMRVVVEHLRKVADSLVATGYSEISINLARDAFASEPHLHKFFTYLLYSGREQGTQVFEGDSVISQLEIRDNIANRNDRTVIASVPDSLLRMCPISDVKNGLLVPPGIPHRAVPSECYVSKAEANLVIALLAFKPVGA